MRTTPEGRRAAIGVTIQWKCRRVTGSSRPTDRVSGTPKDENLALTRGRSRRRRRVCRDSWGWPVPSLGGRRAPNDMDPLGVLGRSVTRTRRRPQWGEVCTTPPRAASAQLTGREHGQRVPDTAGSRLDDRRHGQQHVRVRAWRKGSSPPRETHRGVPLPWSSVSGASRRRRCPVGRRLLRDCRSRPCCTRCGGRRHGNGRGRGGCSPVGRIPPPGAQRRPPGSPICADGGRDWAGFPIRRCPPGATREERREFL